MSPIVVSAIISSPISKVWECYTNPDHIVGWNFASDDWCCPKASGDLKVGGIFSSRMEAKDGSVGFDFHGYYTEIVVDALIKYTMGKPTDQGSENIRKVEVRFDKLSETETNVAVTFDPETENPLEMQQAGWQSILNNFKTYTETH